MGKPENILIVGSGPTGLGAAYRLKELGYLNFQLLEMENNPGGLAKSVVDSKGFTWDLGGHVQFSHYSYYDQVLDKALGDQWFHHVRESWNWIKGRFIPYPFQYNFHLLDEEEKKFALDELRKIALNPPPKAPRNFLEWIDGTFGKGIASLYMKPYNFKVWGFPLELLSCAWVGERVAIPDVDRVERNIRENKMDCAWGPNHTFRFPAVGGTGAIWNSVAKLVGLEKIRFGSQVAQIDLNKKEVVLTSGEKISYDILLNTIPIDIFFQLTKGIDTHVQESSKKLLYSSVHVIGIGLKGKQPEALAKKNWIYFPGQNSPYYRVTVFSNYSKFNVPRGNDYWSLLVETSETSYKRCDENHLKEWVLRALVEDLFIPVTARIESYWHQKLEHGYPTPSINRDEILDLIHSKIEAVDVYSRGRFGGWKYEVSNQDHSFMQGVEWADRIIKGTEEVTYFHPEKVNSNVQRDK